MFKKGRRNKKESAALKEEIVRLNQRRKPVTEIGQQLHVSKQYVSQVLNSLGLSPGRKPRQLKRQPDYMTESILRLEERGEGLLAESLRLIRQRRSKHTAS